MRKNYFCPVWDLRLESIEETLYEVRAIADVYISHHRIIREKASSIFTKTLKNYARLFLCEAILHPESLRQYLDIGRLTSVEYNSL